MNQSWGVMDVLAVTDFPDIRLKTRHPLGQPGQPPDHPARGRLPGPALHRAGRRSATGRCWRAAASPRRSSTAVANRILHPYSLDVSDVGWWSVYEIGQRLCDKFDDVPVEEMPDRLPRVFIAGDACHTHSAKAGQGMNVSMADAWNLGWKLGAVLRGTARPGAAAHLLRRAAGGRRRSSSTSTASSPGCSARRRRTSPERADGVDPEEFQAHFAAQGRFTAGVATRYEPSMITGDGRPPAPGRGLPRRDALPLRPGRPARRRQAGPARPRRPGRRRLAAVRLRRPRRPGGPRLAGPRAVRLPGVGEVTDRPVHPGRRRPRLGHRRPRRLPAGRTASSPSTGCRRSCSPARAASG